MREGFLKKEKKRANSHLVVLVNIRERPHSAHDLLGGRTSLLEAAVPLLLGDVVLASSKLVEARNKLVVVLRGCVLCFKSV